MELPPKQVSRHASVTAFQPEVVTDIAASLVELIRASPCNAKLDAFETGAIIGVANAHANNLD